MRRFAQPRLLAVAALILSAAGLSAMAEGYAHASNVVRARALSGWEAAEGRHVVGLEIAPSPGWRTYWRSPGSAGIAPHFDWAGSTAVRAVALHWPVPRVFRGGGALSIGYDAPFVLPITVETGPEPARLAATLDIGVCAEVCVPVRLDLAWDLPGGDAADPRLGAALADGPRGSDGAASCEVRPAPHGLTLSALIEVPPLGGREAVVFELDAPDVWVDDAFVRRAGRVLSARADVVAPDGGTVAFDPAAVRITVIGEREAVEMVGCSTTEAAQRRRDATK
jgi:DsbC/DsbD-like thiol-disulfide interchange protein